jgi:hypothetical protein
LPVWQNNNDKYQYNDNKYKYDSDNDNKHNNNRQPPIQWVPGALSLAVKWPGRAADHSPPFSAEVKE